MTDTILPPGLYPESPEQFELVDDLTVKHSPSQARGITQRITFGDPRWRMKRKYKAMRAIDKALMFAMLDEARGALITLRATPGFVQQGSFACPELLTNNEFRSGVTGWSLNTGTALSVSNGIAQVQRTDTTTAPGILQSVISVVQYAPYCARALTWDGRGTMDQILQLADGTGDYLWADATVAGYKTVSKVSYSALDSFALITLPSQAYMPGDYFSVPWTSLARCALVDNAPNMLPYSNTFSSPWTLNGATAGNNGTSAPDGQLTAQYLLEDTSTGSHYTSQAQSVISFTNQGYSHSVYVHAGNRSWCYLQILESIGGTAATVFFNASTGALGTVSAGSNWADVRGFATDVGGGWFRFTVSARKTNASPVVTVVIGAATANSTSSYTGTAASAALLLWHASLSNSPLPVRDVLTITTNPAIGTAQAAGSGLYTRGWPVSAAGLLLAGDYVEIGGELKRLTAPVNSDAEGRAYIQFRPRLFRSPADGDPVIVNKPMGRFLASNIQWDNLYGLYADLGLTLDEVYE